MTRFDNVIIRVAITTHHHHHPFNLSLYPFSAIPIVAVGIGSTGAVYLGVNLEFEGLPHQYSIHANQFLVTNLALNFEEKLEYLAITSLGGHYFDAPCGHCRQFLQELPHADDIEVLIKDAANVKLETLGNLFPRSFVPARNLERGTHLLLGHGPNLLSLSDGDLNCRRDSERTLRIKALAAANKSFAPYGQSPSGVALMDSGGHLYAGWFMESVALSPSVGPLQAALVDFVTRSGGRGFSNIVNAVLVEKRGAKVGQADTARILLQKITGGNCRLDVFYCSEEH
ncbi:unnamed protein product [Microthlaspi erraticum]|uniref:CMP/dCMP-type deaminase domain-containing protein n=1 Tax=Microthlaspi erraticum TaxID=1685480 RepID=A0A6D2IKE8_9BRAS|nr:unnamed protein product [Microthlaspi erraticum]